MADPEELLKHTRVVDLQEVAENEFNLNVPRYMDTFEPEPRVDVRDALKAVHDANAAAQSAQEELNRMLESIGYATD